MSNRAKGVFGHRADKTHENRVWHHQKHRKLRGVVPKEPNTCLLWLLLLAAAAIGGCCFFA